MPVLAECRDRQQFGGGDDTLAAAPVDAYLEHDPPDPDREYGRCSPRAEGHPCGTTGCQICAMSATDPDGAPLAAWAAVAAAGR